jgi:hypothetical protein
MQNTKKINIMKTKAIVCGMVVAALSTLVMSRAQAQDIPAIKVVSTDQTDVIKVIYGYSSNVPVSVKFLNSQGIVYQEKLTGRDVEKGFMKKYDVVNMKNDDLWVVVDGQELSVTFKMATSRSGKWSAQLEKVTHNFPTIALN